MRILMSAGFYDVGGFSTVMEKLASKFTETGHDVTIGALRFDRFPAKGTYSVSKIPIGNILRLRKFLGNFDVIHNHHPIMNYMALVSRKPFMYHYHGALDFERGNLLRYSLLFSIRMTNHRLDTVIAVSEAASSELRKYFDSSKIRVVFNGVDTNLFKPGLEEKFRKGMPQYLFVGNLYEHKKVNELILALKKLVKMYPRAHLQIVGKGRTYPKLNNLINTLNLQKHVDFVGIIPHDDLPYYYSSCDVYVTASRLELSPLPLLEAWACGKPVVASSIPGHEELLSRSRAGMLYKSGDLDDLCATMINAYSQGADFKNHAIQFARENEWSTIANKVLRIYNELRARVA